LKTLYFHSCQYYGGIETFKISPLHLTNLSISSFRVDEEFNPDYEIELCTPRLKYL